MQKRAFVITLIVLALVAVFAGSDILAQTSGGGGGGGWVDVPPDATQSWWDAILMGVLVVALIVGTLALLIFV